MNTIKSLSKFFLLGLVTAVASLTACKKDDFTEEDLLNQQIEIQKEGVSVTYTITVFSTANIQSASNRTAGSEEASVAGGASVVLTQNDTSMVKATDSLGRVVFRNIKEGSVGLTVSLADHTTCYAITDVWGSTNNEGTDGNASTNIYLFPTTVEMGAAVVTGMAYAETDFTNNEEEPAAGATLNAFIDVNAGEFQTAYWSQNHSSGYIQELVYVSSVSSATVQNDGSFSIVVPSGNGTNNGLPIIVRFDEFEADQTLVFDGAQTTFSGIFGSTLGLSAIPTDAGVSVTPGALTTAGSGVTFTFEPQGSGIDDADVIAGGSGYPTLNNADSIFVIQATVTGDTTDTGFTRASITVTVSPQGNVVSVAVNNPGAGYLSEPQFNMSYGGGTGAQILVDFDQNYKAILNNGGTGYFFLPNVKFSVRRHATLYQLENEIDEINLNTGNFEIVNGSIVLPNPGTNYLGSFTINNAAEEPTMVAELPMERRAAEFSVVVDPDNGSITSVTILDGGLGYDPFTLPVLTTATLVAGSGTGAQVIVDQVDPATGEITDIQVVRGGSGYLQFANNPSGTAGADGTISLTVTPGETYNRDYRYGTGFRRGQEMAELGG